MTSASMTRVRLSSVGGPEVLVRGINDATMAEIDRVADEVMTNTMYDLYCDATPNFHAYHGWGPQMDAAQPFPG